MIEMFFHIEFDTTVDESMRRSANSMKPLLSNQADLVKDGEACVTYEIGDALGVHGHNDESLVNSFLSYYGLNPLDVVYIDRSENLNKVKKQRKKRNLSNTDPRFRIGSGVYEVRTIKQLFTQVLDVFGETFQKVLPSTC